MIGCGDRMRILTGFRILAIGLLLVFISGCGDGFLGISFAGSGSGSSSVTPPGINPPGTNPPGTNPPGTDPPETTGNPNTSSCIVEADLRNYTNEATGKGKDPLQDFQWYLEKTYVLDAWRRFPNADGEGIEISVVDNHFQFTHEDLADNFIANASINAYSGGNLLGVEDSCYSRHAHGTAVSGIIAAVGSNNRGIRGIAYKAKIWGANLLSRTSFRSKDFIKVFNHRVEQTAVSSNSWGVSALGTLSYLHTERFHIIEEGINKGFYGKGISYVFSGGNNRRSGERAGYSSILNHPGVIPVCAVGADNNVSGFSEPGANLWICGYSKSSRGIRINTSAAVETPSALQLQLLGIPTTDISGEAGYNRGSATRVYLIPKAKPNPAAPPCRFTDSIFDFASPYYIIPPACEAPHRMARKLVWTNGTTISYTRYFGGTSASAPMISGIIAMLRSANRTLGWRDVKLILAASAWQPQAANASGELVIGAPTYNDNSTHYAHHDDYGFGIVNASKALDLAQTWRLLPPQIKWSSPDGAEQNISYSVDANKNITFVEYVQAEILDGQPQPNFGNMFIRLISPTGRISVLSTVHRCYINEGVFYSPTPTDDCREFQNRFIFGSAAHLGETPKGNWQLIAEKGNGDHIPLNWKLHIYGHNRAD